MKKIMIIHHSGSIGGAGISAYNTILSLSNKYEVVIYCPSRPSDYSNFLESKGINVRTFDFPLGSIHYYSGGVPVYSPIFIKNLLRIKKYKSKWKEIILKESPDLIIVNSKITSWFSTITKELQMKSVCFVRETRKKELLKIWNNVQKYFLNKFTGVVFISEYDKNIENLKVPKTMVVPNFLNLNLYEQKRNRNDICEEFGIQPNGFNILFVGGVARIKGIDTAVESMQYLTNHNVNLIVVGDSEFHYSEQSDPFVTIYNYFKRKYEDKIKRTVEKFDLEKRIIKVGIQKDMADMYTIADVLIFPANQPHQARPAFEAGAQKKPVLMPDFENTKEYVKNEENGLIFKRRNSKSLAECIIRLIKDPVLKDRLGENNYNLTLKKHTKEHSEEILLSMVNEIMEESIEPSLLG